MNQIKQLFKEMPKLNDLLKKLQKLDIPDEDEKIVKVIQSLRK